MFLKKYFIYSKLLDSHWIGTTSVQLFLGLPYSGSHRIFVSFLALSPATPAGLFLSFWDRYTESPRVSIKELGFTRITVHFP